ncbi:MAG: pyruvate kinase [Candidatus Acidiferrales bacterium]
MKGSLKQRRAKIVCTIGPATSSPEALDRLVREGMDVARLNFSHGSPAEHAQRVAAVRRAGMRHEKPVAILADLQGPKIRTGVLAGGRAIELCSGQRLTITTENVPGTQGRISTNFRPLAAAVRRGDRILLSDGEIELRVERVRGREILCRVVNGGRLGEHQGINLPGVKLRVPSLTPKDRRDLGVALGLGVNYVALSFVRTAADVRAAKSAIARAGKKTPLIAKLEKPEALDNLDEILSAADGVMVARGDLGVEMGPEKVPVAQKRIIARARDFLLPVITATQMLDSMKDNPRPTRAEASDVANAIFDGSDALMLSGETAVGHYPFAAVAMMDRIIREAEASISHPPLPQRIENLRVNETIAETVCHAAEELCLKLVAVFTESGSSARLISKYRPRAPIIAFSQNAETRRKMSLYWGVTPRSIQRVADIDELAAIAEKRLGEEKLVRRGDVIALVAGTPFGVPGTTNFLKFHVIGSAK